MREIARERRGRRHTANSVVKGGKQSEMGHHVKDAHKEEPSGTHVAKKERVQAKPQKQRGETTDQRHWTQRQRGGEGGTEFPSNKAVAQRTTGKVE